MYGNIAFAEEYAEYGECECDEGDDEAGVNTVGEGRFESESYAYDEGVDAGGESEEADDSEIGWVDGFEFFFASDAVGDHLAANDGKQTEGNPVVNGCDQRTKGVAQ